MSFLLKHVISFHLLFLLHCLPIYLLLSRQTSENTQVGCRIYSQSFAHQNFTQNDVSIVEPRCNEVAIDKEESEPKLTQTKRCEMQVKHFASWSSFPSRLWSGVQTRRSFRDLLPVCNFKIVESDKWAQDERLKYVLIGNKCLICIAFCSCFQFLINVCDKVWLKCFGGNLG